MQRVSGKIFSRKKQQSLVILGCHVILRKSFFCRSTFGGPTKTTFFLKVSEMDRDPFRKFRVGFEIEIEDKSSISNPTLMVHP